VAHVAGKIGHRQQVALARDDHFVLRLRMASELTAQRPASAGNFGAQRLHLGLRRSRTCSMASPHSWLFRKLAPRPVGLGIIGFGKDDAVLHIAIGRHDDDQQAALGQSQKFDVPKHRRARGAITTPTNCDRLDSRLAALEMTFCGWSGARLCDAQDGHAARSAWCPQTAVATRSRNAPRRGMGADDQAQLLQVRHHIADGGRRQFQPRRLGQACANPPGCPSAM
jgi:hypothetical protein